MIYVNQACRADICISASKCGFWIKGTAGGEKIDVTLSSAAITRGYLIALEKLCGQSLIVYDMTGRVFE